MKAETKRTPAVTVVPAAQIADKLDCELVSEKKLNLTKSRAYEFLEMDTFQGERPVSELHVQRLYNAYVAGSFMWEHVIIALCDCDGKRYRLNGQHSCWLRVNIEKEDLPDAIVREVVYKVKEEAMMRRLYATFDQNKTRTPGHVMKSLLVGTPVAADLWSSTVGVLSSGVRLWLYEKDNNTVTVPDIAEIISFKYADLFKVVGLFWQSQYDHFQPIKRAAVIASLFATFSASSSKAREFWEPVCSGLNLSDKRDARWQLRHFLETHSHGRSQQTNQVNAEEMFRICIQAWNRWRRGEHVLGLRITDKRVKAI